MIIIIIIIIVIIIIIHICSWQCGRVYAYFIIIAIHFTAKQQYFYYNVY